ncbi:MAG: hypothetical protein H7844_06045 [Nitrospirae bacterium YQR-1]
MERAGGDLKFVYICTSVFFILTLFNILHHEMWRDELEAWMIAAEASSLHGLIENMRYQGHPMLWHLILYPITRLTRNPVAMQMVHLLIATLSSFVFLRFAPFNKLSRTLFVFGYFPFFEYATISRNYAAGILFLFIFCVCFGKDLKSRNYLTLSVILFLMCQCNALSTVLAIALALTIFLEPLLLKDYRVYRTGRLYVSILIFTSGLLLSVIQLIPPADARFYNPVIVTPVFLQKTAGLISSLWNVFVPVPRFQLNFWHTNFLSYLPLQQEMIYVLKLSLSLGLLLFSLFIVLRKKIPAFYYALSVIGVTAFGYIFYEGYTRHKAHYYFAFVTALWLNSYYPSQTIPLNAFFSFFEKNKTRFITAVFSLSMAGALTANTIDFMYPFSESKEAANYIKQNYQQNMPVAGHWFYAASAVSAYLDRAFYYPVIDKTGTFTVWKSIKDETVDVLKYVDRYRNSIKTDVLFIVNENPLPDDVVQQNGLIPLRHFTKSIVKSENFFLYMIKYE